ncbi:MAG: hypothetical protein ABI880_00925 [Acidobacteriota bacterium]
MMRTTLTTAALGLLVTGTLLAQTPAPSPAPQPAPAPFQNLQVPTRITTGTSVTGCLKQRDAGTSTAAPAGVGASAAAPTSASMQYVLINVEPTSAPTTTAVPGTPVPPSGRTSGAGGPVTYLLQPSLFVDLAVHVNQQVQVTGAMASDADPWFGAPRTPAPGAVPPGSVTPPAAPAVGSSPALPAAAPPSARASQGGSIPPTFIVSSITMVAKTCS